MKFRELGIRGCFEVELEPRADERGWFSRAFCTSEFQARGLDPVIAQVNTSFSHDGGTLRGLHYQRGHAAEAKTVRAIRGAAFDVVVDLRRDSPTFLQWTSIELSSDQRNAIHVPKGCAHGILTLEDNTELLYAVSTAYEPTAEAGLRWDDPAFNVRWPREPVQISAKDRAWPLWSGN